MVTLISRESHQKFSGGTIEGRPPLHPSATLTVTVETGVAVFTLLGTNPYDWTRDTLAFPVGAAGLAPDFVSGIASAAPTSVRTPMNNVAMEGGGSQNIPVNVTGSDSNNSSPLSGQINIQLPSFRCHRRSVLRLTPRSSRTRNMPASLYSRWRLLCLGTALRCYEPVWRTAIARRLASLVVRRTYCSQRRVTSGFMGGSMTVRVFTSEGPASRRFAQPQAR